MKFARLNSKNGVTLIELLVVIVISGIILSSVFAFFLFSTRFFDTSVNQFSVQNNIRLASGHLTDQMRYAAEVTILGSIAPEKVADPLNNVDAYLHYIFFQNDSIIDLSKYSTKSFYVGSGGSAFFESTSGTILNFTFMGTEKNQDYYIDTEVKPLNLTLKGNTITIDSGSVLCYRTIDDILSKEAMPIATLGDITDPEELMISYSKGIISVTKTSDNDPSVASTVSKADTFNLNLHVDNPGASSGRVITIDVLLDDGNVYAYSITFGTEWSIY